MAETATTTSMDAEKEAALYGAVSLLTHRHLPYLEAAIGSPPGTTPANSDRRLIERWLNIQGIPVIGPHGTSRAATKKLFLAYSRKAYLEGWLRNMRAELGLNGATQTSELESLFKGLGDTAPTPTATTPMSPPIADTADDNAPAATPTAALTAAQLQDLETRLNTHIDEKFVDAEARLTAGFKAIEPTLSDRIRDRIRELAAEAARETLAEHIGRTITVHNPVRGTTANLGLQHEKFDLLLRLCQAKRPDGQRLNIWISGPTQSGKTTAAKNVAKALDLPFFAESSLDEDYKVVGYKQPDGTVVRTQFREALEHGGVFLADEADNWNPSAWTALNAPLANGFGVFPDGIIPRHPDCVIIAAANTWGLGADNDYVGRNKLDAATLARFRPQIHWPYDEALERAIAARHSADGEAWAKIVQAARRTAKERQLKIIISPNDMIAGLALLDTGFAVSELAELTFGASLPRDRLADLIRGVQ